jgi:hypothetical protein
MNLDLTDEATAALTRELHDIVERDRYPLSPRIRTLRAILAKLSPEPVREPLLPRKVYAPPRAALARRRRAGRFGRWDDVSIFGVHIAQADAVAYLAAVE